MRKLFFLIIFLAVCVQPVSALNLVPPEVPESGMEAMPEHPDNVQEGFRELIRHAVESLRPDLAEASRVSVSIISAVMLVSLLKTFSGSVSLVSDMAGTAAIAGGLLLTSNTMIRLGTDTVVEISEYGKLLLPVMTAALAAQGGVTSSTALFAGTAGFSALLGSLISGILIPLTYLYLALAVGNSALGEDLLKKLRDLVKSIVSWSLKTLLTVFTTLVGLSGVVSGTADAAALRAAKATVSTVVPVVGGILSGASEAMLLSAGVLKNAAGIYGIFAVLAIFLDPFLRILTHYWILKLTAAVCSVFGSSRSSELVGDFSTAMGFLLAMTGSACLMLLIGTVCFMKGVG